MSMSRTFFLDAEAQFWAAKMANDTQAVYDIIHEIQHWKLPATLASWQHYYQAYGYIILCQLGVDTGVNAKKAVEVLKNAHGTEHQSAEFYTLTAAAHGHLAGATLDPIGKAKAGIVCENSYKYAFQADEDNPRALLSQGLSFLHKPKLVGGSKKKAKMFLQQALDAFSRRAELQDKYPWPAWGAADASYWLAHCCLHFNEFDRAKQLIDDALEHFPNFHWGRVLQQKIVTKRAS